MKKFSIALLLVAVAGCSKNELKPADSLITKVDLPPIKISPKPFIPFSKVYTYSFTPMILTETYSKDIYHVDEEFSQNGKKLLLKGVRTDSANIQKYSVTSTQGVEYFSFKIKDSSITELVSKKEIPWASVTSSPLVPYDLYKSCMKRMVYACFNSKTCSVGLTAAPIGYLFGFAVGCIFGY